MRRHNQGIWRKIKTNGRRTFLVGVIGQLCGTLLKGQALVHVQKLPSDSGLFMTLVNPLQKKVKKGSLVGLS